MCEYLHHNIEIRFNSNEVRLRGLIGTLRIGRNVSFNSNEVRLREPFEK